MRSFYFLKGYNHAFNTTLEIEKNKPFQKKSKSKYINFDLKIIFIPEKQWKDYLLGIWEGYQKASKKSRIEKREKKGDYHYRVGWWKLAFFFLKNFPWLLVKYI